jgi:hypothetical protein
MAKKSATQQAAAITVNDATIRLIDVAIMMSARRNAQYDTPSSIELECLSKLRSLSPKGIFPPNLRTLPVQYRTDFHRSAEASTVDDTNHWPRTGCSRSVSSRTPRALTARIRRW